MLNCESLQQDLLLSVLPLHPTLSVLCVLPSGYGFKPGRHHQWHFVCGEFNTVSPQARELCVSVSLSFSPPLFVHHKMVDIYDRHDPSQACWNIHTHSHEDWHFLKEKCNYCGCIQWKSRKRMRSHTHFKCFLVQYCFSYFVISTFGLDKICSWCSHLKKKKNLLLLIECCRDCYEFWSLNTIASS